jgi:ATP-binding cassette subfamily C protein
MENNTAPSRYTWEYVWRIALRHKREMALAHAVAVLAAVLSVPIPLLMPVLVDEVLLDRPGPAVAAMDVVFPVFWHGPVLYILAVLLVTLVLRFSALALGVWQMRQFTRTSKDVIYRIRRDLLLRLQRVSMAEYETLGSGTVASHLVTDLDVVDQFVGISVSRFLVAVLSIVGTAVVLLWMHWQLALFILLMNPLVVYLTMVLGRRVKRLKQRENEAYAGFQQQLTETLEGIQQIRASNRESHYLGTVIGQADQVRKYSAAFAWKSDAANRVSSVVFMFGFDVFRTVSMLMVLFSDLSIGQMLAVFSYLWFMMGPVQEVLNIQYGYHGASAALERINGLLQMHDEPRYPHRKDPFRGVNTTSIRLQNVSFSYRAGTRVLDGVSLFVEPGEKVALVGASGGGKTTLVQVVLGLYPPDEGRILYGDVAVTEIGLDVVRDNVATVLQHPVLFNDTVRANLSLGRELSDGQLWRALEIAQLEDIVGNMDAGLDTVIGRQGVRLSGGQRQRIAIARMVLVDPRIVIMDEATSALDTAVEERVHAGLRTFLSGRTTLIIAHRLSAVKQADRALVFDSGRIIEEGRHDQLIYNDGLYARLYGSQV